MLYVSTSLVLIAQTFYLDGGLTDRQTDRQTKLTNIQYKITDVADHSTHASTPPALVTTENTTTTLTEEEEEEFIFHKQHR